PLRSKFLRASRRGNGDTGVSAGTTCPQWLHTIPVPRVLMADLPYFANLTSTPWSHIGCISSDSDDLPYSDLSTSGKFAPSSQDESEHTFARTPIVCSIRELHKRGPYLRRRLESQLPRDPVI